MAISRLNSCKFSQWAPPLPCCSALPLSPLRVAAGVEGVASEDELETEAQPELGLFCCLSASSICCWPTPKKVLRRGDTMEASQLFRTLKPFRLLTDDDGRLAAKKCCSVAAGCLLVGVEGPVECAGLFVLVLMRTTNERTS